MPLNRLRATPILTDSVSRNYFDFDLRKFDFDSFHAIECFKNGMFTVLLRNRLRSTSTIATFSINNMQDPENRVFDYYTIPRFPDKMRSFELNLNIVIEVSELGKQYFRGLNLNGPLVYILTRDEAPNQIDLNLDVFNARNTTRITQRLDLRPNMNRLNFVPRTGQVEMKNEKDYKLEELFSTMGGNIFELRGAV